MRCYSCNSESVFYDHYRGEFSCTRCGLVIFDRALESGPEWRTKVGESGERADVGSGIDYTLHDLGMGSSFNLPNDVSPANRARLRRMREIQKRSKTIGWQERSLREAMIELDKICEDLSIPKGIKTEASMIYRRAKSKGLTGGRNMSQVLAAAIFLSCRLRGIARTEGEVSDSIAARYGFESKKCERTIRRIVRALKCALQLDVRRISPDEYIDKYSTKLGISRASIEKAHQIHQKFPRKFLQSKSPLFLAAIMIYLGVKETGELVTLKQVADGVGVGVSSLSQNATQFKKIIQKDLNEPTSLKKRI